MVSRFRLFLLIGGMLPMMPVRLHAQSPQRFEVAAIRRTTSGAGDGTSFNVFEGGRLRITNEPPKLLIRAAFQLQNSQIQGGPDWLDTDRYDIEAKTGLAGKIEPGQMGPLLQNLLADRFDLKFHREVREQSVFALVVEKGRQKLKPSAEGESTAMNTHGGREKSQLVATGVSLAALASYVGNRLGRIVVDQTGLNEKYDFTLEWSPDEPSSSAAPSLVTALSEQLGLRLQSQKGPVEVLVIDRLERPSDN